VGFFSPFSFCKKKSTKEYTFPGICTSAYVRRKPFPVDFHLTCGDVKLRESQEANQLPGVKALEKFFADAGLSPRVGFNIGTRAVSLTVQLPSGANNITPPRPDELVQCLTWIMLGIHPEQHRLEQEYAGNVGDAVNTGNAGKVQVINTYTQS
jgi:hypothetical protein